MQERAIFCSSVNLTSFSYLNLWLRAIFSIFGRVVLLNGTKAYMPYLEWGINRIIIRFLFHHCNYCFVAPQFKRCQKSFNWQCHWTTASPSEDWQIKCPLWWRAAQPWVPETFLGLLAFSCKIPFVPSSNPDPFNRLTCSALCSAEGPTSLCLLVC